MSNKENNWITLSSSLQYDNPWITVTECDVINPSGNKGIYGKVHFKNLAIGIIPMDDNGNVYMVGQYRFTLGKYSLEIPEGGGDLNQAPLESAKRELAEETGLKAEFWEHILTMHLSNSVTDELAMVYLATGLSQGESSPEDTEKLDVVCMPLEKLYQMVINHEITDSMTVAGILHAKVLSLQK